MTAISLRLICLGVAFSTGWIVYMIAMLMTVYDGILSMIFQPIMAAIFSAVLTVVAWALGWLLKLPGVRTVWHGSILPACILIAAALFFLCLGYYLGFTAEVEDEFGGKMLLLDPAVGFGAYCALIFAIANFPLLRLLKVPIEMVQSIGGPLAVSPEPAPQPKTQ